MATDPELEHAYRHTTYAAETPVGRVSIRIGKACAVLDDLLDLLGRRRWAVVTAWNPRSQPSPREENDRRQAELLTVVAQLPHYLATNEPDDGDAAFQEESVLIVGIDAEAATELGRRFEQNAVVVGEVGASARLAWCI